MDKILKAALYARVSTRDKQQNPLVQLEPMREYCRSMGWQVYQEYIDLARAGDLSNRKNWAQMMQDAALHKFDVILVWKTDRAFRLAAHAHNTLEMLKSYNIRFRSYSEPEMDTATNSGKILFAFLAIWAEVESDGLGERVTAGMDYARVHGTKSGLPIGHPKQPVDLPSICKAIRSTSPDHIKANYTAAARELVETFKIKSLNAGFVSLRLKREAAARSINVPELVKEILQGKIA